ncbi:helix-turn-helix domain-containing protein [Streptomyces sp. XM4011]|uniref:helix-turn-helix domain-containing protein n=1 Tax=Streptomyces TaxID=1883 RepID=UPI001FF84AA2|nr:MULTISPECIES: helix-turn-helix transcriptional regulator [Streptomyces]MCK1816029.1 helix-turn-helix domain-containing protein [Streptomyces sp. XM4011]
MSDEISELPTTYRYFGQQFQLWRQAAQVRRETVAEATSYSVDMVKSVEQGRRKVPARMAEIADEMFGAKGILLAGLSHLKRDKFPVSAQDFMIYENQAIAMEWYENSLIPGLLQTEEYASALIGGWWPPLDEETVVERVQARMERQALLNRTPPVAFNFVIYEAALWAPIGGPEVRRGQLLHLLTVGELRNVALHVLPYDRTIPAALDGPMVLLETADHEHFVYQEAYSQSRLTSDPHEVSTQAQRYGMIRGQALSSAESARFIERMAGEG